MGVNLFKILFKVRYIHVMTPVEDRLQHVCSKNEQNLKSLKTASQEKNLYILIFHFFSSFLFSFFTSNFFCRFLNPIFSNLNYNCSNLLDVKAGLSEEILNCLSLKEGACILFFCHSHNNISNVYFLVLSKATG